MYSTPGLHVHCVYKLIRLGHLTPHDYTRSHDTIQHIQKRDRTSREYLLLMQRLTRHVSVIRTTNSRRGVSRRQRRNDGVRTIHRKTFHRRTKKGKGSPYSITERRVPELIPVLCSQPAGDVSHKPGGRLPLLSVRPAVTLATLKSAATSFAAY